MPHRIEINAEELFGALEKLYPLYGGEPFEYKPGYYFASNESSIDFSREDKVRIMVYRRRMFVMMNRNGQTASITIPCGTCTTDTEFLVSYPGLYCLAKSLGDKSLLLEEIPFWGFEVLNIEDDIAFQVFPCKEYYTNYHIPYNPDGYNDYCVPNAILESLVERYSEFTEGFYDGKIWLENNPDYCRIISTSGRILLANKIDSISERTFTIPIPSCLLDVFFEYHQKTGRESLNVQVASDNTKVILYSDDMSVKMDLSQSMYKKKPDVDKLVYSLSVDGSISISKGDILKILRNAEGIADNDKELVLLHRKGDYLYIHLKPFLSGFEFNDYIKVFPFGKETTWLIPIKYLKTAILDTSPSSSHIHIQYFTDKSNGSEKLVYSIMGDNDATEVRLISGRQLSDEYIVSMDVDERELYKVAVENEMIDGLANLPKIYGLGEPFPDTFPRGIDYSRVIPNIGSFDILISLCDVTGEEETAILDEEFTIHYIAIDMIPHFVLTFGGVNRFGFSLNVMKINEACRESWLESNSSTVSIFLVDAETGNITGIRYFDFPIMNELKQICKKQLAFDMNMIDGCIEMIESRASMDVLLANADRIITIPAPEFSL